MVRDQGQEQSFRPGERVAVPWGLDVIEGTVVSSHGQGPERRVVVSVDLPDTEESQLMTFPVRELEEAAQDASERKPGAWLSVYRYEQALRRALEQLAQPESGLNVWPKSTEESGRTGSHPDFIVDDGDHRLVIEVKAPPSGRVSRNAVDQLLSYMTVSRLKHGLLVTNAALSPDALSELDEAHLRGFDVRAIQWHSPDDNTELDRAIRELLLAA
jgi:Restriction endonuclease